MKLLSGEFNVKTFWVIRDTIVKKTKDVSEHIFEGVSEVEFEVSMSRKINGEIAEPFVPLVTQSMRVKFYYGG